MASDSFVIDSSALICVFDQEPGFREIEERLKAADQILIGTPTILETFLVLSRKASDADQLLDKALAVLGVRIIPFSESHCREARLAFRQFGKGRHPAGLNFGDCMVYALAKVAGMPLLYVGYDFAQTDIPAA